MDAVRECIDVPKSIIRLNNKYSIIITDNIKQLIVEIAEFRKAII